MVDVEQALAADAMSTLTSLLDHPSDRIKTLSALAIFHLRLFARTCYSRDFHSFLIFILVYHFKAKNVLLKSVLSID